MASAKTGQKHTRKVLSVVRIPMTSYLQNYIRRCAGLVIMWRKQNVQIFHQACAHSNLTLPVVFSWQHHFNKLHCCCCTMFHLHIQRTALIGHVIQQSCHSVTSTQLCTLPTSNVRQCCNCDASVCNYVVDGDCAESLYTSVKGYTNCSY